MAIGILMVSITRQRSFNIFCQGFKKWPISKRFYNLHVYKLETPKVLSGCNTTDIGWVAESKVEHQQFVSAKDSPWNVSSGYGFSFVYQQNTNKVLAEGLNYYGQLGVGSSSFDKPEDSISSYVTDWPLVTLTETSEDEKIKRVACGRVHSLILTTSALYASGSNIHGQCGFPSETMTSSKFERVNVGIDPSEINEVCCGFDHSLLLTTDGRVFASGLGADGQTGLGTCECHFGFKEVIVRPDSGKVIAIAACADTSLALTESQEIYGWGNNEYGQVSENSVATQMSSPVKIDIINGSDIVNMYCGGTFTSFLSSNGDLSFQGFTSFGERQNASGLHKSKQARTIIKVQDILEIESAPDYLGILTSKGELITYGLKSRLWFEPGINEDWAYRVCTNCEGFFVSPVLRNEVLC